MPDDSPALRIVVLLGNQLYGEMFCAHIRQHWPKADVRLFRKGMDALTDIQECEPDLFITGVEIEDMDGLEHLEPFDHKRLPILVVTSHKNKRTFEMLQNLRYNGIYDSHEEGLSHLLSAIEQILADRFYVSPGVMPLLKKPKNITVDTLTATERTVLAVIGDGADDQEAAERLKMSKYTVNTHRKSIMAKLGLHHKGELMRYAAQCGYVRFDPDKVTYPGFERLIRQKAQMRPCATGTG